jgi:hypothetical protein
VLEVQPALLVRADEIERAVAVEVAFLADLDEGRTLVLGERSVDGRASTP